MFGFMSTLSTGFALAPLTNRVFDNSDKAEDSDEYASLRLPSSESGPWGRLDAMTRHTHC